MAAKLEKCLNTEKTKRLCCYYYNLNRPTYHQT